VRRDAYHEYEEFVTWVSHELSEPARSTETLLAAIEAEAGYALPEGTSHMLRLARANSARVKEMLKGLREFKEAAEAPRLERVDVDAVASEVLATQIHDLVERRGARVRRVERLPEAAGSPALVAKVIRALVTNAIAHNRGSDPEVEIGGGVLPSGECEYRVRDNGPGIPAEWRERVFRVYARGPGTPRDAPSAGMGLTLARRAVESMGGRIRIDDTPHDPGVIVRFTLPGPASIEAGPAPRAAAPLAKRE
jgi:signal transduction histidine kinase